MTIWFYKIGKAITGFLFRCWYKIEFYGQENQPTDRGYILCCNHRSALDPIMVAQAIKMPIRYMGKEELFRNGFVRFIISHLGAFPVARGKGDRSAIEEAVKTVKSGYVLGLFPEGTRSPDDNLLRFKSGAAVIASQSGGDLLPAAIWYEGKSWRSKVVIRYGKPILASDLAMDGVSARQLRGVVSLLQGEVEKLLEETKACESK